MMAPAQHGPFVAGVALSLPAHSELIEWVLWSLDRWPIWPRVKLSRDEAAEVAEQLVASLEAGGLPVHGLCKGEVVAVIRAQPCVGLCGGRADG